MEKVRSAILLMSMNLIVTLKAVCDKLEENKVIFKRRLYRQDCRLEFQSYTKVKTNIFIDINLI